MLALLRRAGQAATRAPLAGAARGMHLSVRVCPAHTAASPAAASPCCSLPRPLPPLHAALSLRLTTLRRVIGRARARSAAARARSHAHRPSGSAGTAASSSRAQAQPPRGGRPHRRADAREHPRRRVGRDTHDEGAAASGPAAAASRCGVDDPRGAGRRHLSRWHQAAYGPLPCRCDRRCARACWPTDRTHVTLEGRRGPLRQCVRDRPR